uniref:Si:ch211-214j8.12 n=1 Tax=Sander lucioperca TaxID=283035 RepID=A0A8C9ZG62_SANLU
MPLFRASGERGEAKARPGQRRTRSREWMKTDEDVSVLSLTRLCLLSLADNMTEVWTKDYADNYLDHYSFRYIMGPFNLLPAALVEELTRLLCSRKQMSRAALHLLLVPQLRGLSLGKCPGLVTSALCAHITARCQGLWSLDLSGAQQLPSKLLSETLCCLPALRSLSLAGTPCDSYIIRTIAQRCRLLRHLNISRCPCLSPAALLPLGGGPSFPFSGCPSTSLLALDIGFGKEEGDAVSAAAYLLLSLPCLETVELEGLAQACCLIQHRRFGHTDQFSDRERVPRLGEVWREWRHRQGSDRSRERREGAAAGAEDEDEEEEEEERILLNEYGCETEGDEGPSCSQNQAEEKLQGRVSSGDECLILRLKDVKGLSCESLDSLSRACPNICSVSVNVEEDVDTRGGSQGSLLAAGLRAWAGQLWSLSVHFPGPLLDLLPAVDVAGSSLVSLTLQGVRTSPRTPLLEAIKACPRLRDLLISAEPPTGPQDEEDEDDQRDDDRDLPQLPNLCSLTLHFSYEHSQMKAVMSWMSLKRALKCLLTGSPLLEKLSLVSLPCPLDCVLNDVLRRSDSDAHLFADSTDSPRVPLGRLRRVELPRTDVTMVTVKSIMQRSKRLKYVDVNNCWKISLVEWTDCKTFSKVQVVWS